MNAAASRPAPDESIPELLRAALSGPGVRLGAARQRDLFISYLVPVLLLGGSTWVIRLWGALWIAATTIAVAACARRLLGDGFLGLLLGADEEYVPSLGNHLRHVLRGLVQQVYGLLQVDDVDAVAFDEDVPLHLGVPPANLVTEVRPCLQKQLHRYNATSSGHLFRHFTSQYIPAQILVLD